MKLKEGLKINSFCCGGFDWHIFHIEEDSTVYSKCDNPMKERLANA
jgi:hypothetical protein